MVHQLITLMSSFHATSYHSLVTILLEFTLKHQRSTQVHQRLGDHLNETGNFLDASKEYRKCLSIREDVLESNDRLLADAHFTLAESLRHAKQIEKALEHYKRAQGIIQLCLDSCGKKVTTTTTTTGERKENDRSEENLSSSNASEEEEKNTLRNILLDLQAKIDEFEKKTESTKKDIASTTTIGFGTKTTDSNTTIGFGNNKDSAASTTIGFGGGAKKRALEASANVLSVRTVVKKAKRVEDEKN